MQLNDILTKLKFDKDSDLVEAHNQILGLFSVKYCADFIRNTLCSDLVEQAKKQPDKVPKEVPAMVNILIAIQEVEKHL